MIELKPCPACGSASIDLIENKLEVYKSWSVRCKSCTSPCMVTRMNREEAVAVWNDLWCWKELARLAEEKEMARQIADSNLEGRLGAAKLDFDEAIRKLQAELDQTKEELKKKPTIIEVTAKPEPVGTTVLGDIDWKYRYDKLKAGYIHTRMEVSGSFGNSDFATRKRVLEHEISNEVGFEI